MNNKDKILRLLHKIFRNDIITNEIAGVTGKQIDNIEIIIKDIENQNYFDTATWGLDIFEKELDLKHNFTKTPDERRKIISAKWRGVGILTLELIQQTVDALIDYYVSVSFTGKIVINFSEKIGYPKNLNDIYAAIEDIKPAHLGVEYIFRFRKHEEVARYRHRDLSGFTHKQIREQEILINYRPNNEVMRMRHSDLSKFTNEHLRNKDLELSK